MFDALEGTRGACLLGEPIHQRPVLPDPAPPRCSAVRRPDPIRPWYVRILDSTGCDANGVLLIVFSNAQWFIE